MSIRKECFKRIDEENNDNFSKCKEYTKCSFNIKYDGISCLPTKYLKNIIYTYNEKNINNQIKYDNKKIDDKKYIINLLINKLGEDQLDWINIIEDNKMIKKYYKYFLPIISDKKYEWLNTININEIFKRYEVIFPDFKFLGSVPCDYYFDDLNINDLLKLGKTRFAVVYNTDNSRGPGQHWVAIFSDIEKKEIYYYNSVGEKPQKEFKKFIDIIIDQYKKINNGMYLYKYNKKKHQYKGSECGVFSIYFIIRCLKKYDIDDIFNNKMNIKDDEVNKLRDLLFIFKDKNIDYFKYYEL